MDQQQIEKMFRAQELERRHARMAVLVNHANLADEPLTEEEKATTEFALRKIRESNEAFAKATRPRRSYLKNLWMAVKGKY